MTNCKSCGDRIDWKKMEGRWRCFNTGTQIDHWDTCSKRRWKQTISTGKRFENEKDSRGNLVSGYANSIHGTKLDHIECQEIVGAKYKPSGCNCGVPPWELCKIDCDNSLTQGR